MPRSECFMLETFPRAYLSKAPPKSAPLLRARANVRALSWSFLKLNITSQYISPLCCLAGDDCLRPVLRGNSRLESPWVGLWKNDLLPLCCMVSLRFFKSVHFSQPLGDCLKWGGPPKLWCPAMHKMSNFVFFLALSICPNCPSS